MHLKSDSDNGSDSTDDDDDDVEIDGPLSQSSQHQQSTPAQLLMPDGLYCIADENFLKIIF